MDHYSKNSDSLQSSREKCLEAFERALAEIDAYQPPPDVDEATPQPKPPQATELEPVAISELSADDVEAIEHLDAKVPPSPIRAIATPVELTPAEKAEIIEHLDGKPAEAMPLPDIDAAQARLDAAISAEQRLVAELAPQERRQRPPAMTATKQSGDNGRKRQASRHRRSQSRP